MSLEDASSCGVGAHLDIAISWAFFHNSDKREEISKCASTLFTKGAKLEAIPSSSLQWALELEV